MSAEISHTKQAALRRHGLETLITAGLLALAIAGLLLLPSQVTVFDFGDGGPDARFFPRLVLSLLAGLAALRLWRARRTLDTGLGAPVAWGRTLIVVTLMAAAIAAMPQIGFLAVTALTGVALAWLLGERRWLPGILLPLAVALAVTLCARHALNLPLP
ncbi:hypothetical protein EHLJMEHL_00498 [Vreelandella titanicae]